MIRIHSLALALALATVSTAAFADPPAPKKEEAAKEKGKGKDKGDKDKSEKGDKDKSEKGDKDKSEKGDKDKSEKGRWEKLGERSVDGKMDKDTIAVGREDGLFDAIQLKVEGSAVAIFDVKVTFMNGTSFEPKTKVVFNKDTKSHVIDLPGDKRAIKKIELRYGNLPGGGKASVEVWGRDQSEKKDKGAEKASAESETGWEKLGERSVDGKLDKDTIAVGKKDGVFTAIRVKVEGSAVEMFDIKVTFENGTTFEPKTKLVFAKDSWTRVIDLPGDKRIIKKVDFKYGNLPGGGKARVELWGKH